MNKGGAGGGGSPFSLTRPSQERPGFWQDRYLSIGEVMNSSIREKERLDQQDLSNEVADDIGARLARVGTQLQGDDGSEWGTSKYFPVMERNRDRTRFPRSRLDVFMKHVCVCVCFKVFPPSGDQLFSFGQHIIGQGKVRP